MKKFQKAHLWLIIPFLIAFIGFYFSYWSKLKEAKFHQHLHGLSATAWYVLIIFQPFLYQRSKMNLHRKLGYIGVFLAGGVVFSAFKLFQTILYWKTFLKTSAIVLSLPISFLFSDFLSQ